MKKPIPGKIISAATMFYVAMFFTTGLQAALIKTGQFSLVQDNDSSNGIDQGELVASVTFTAEDTSATNMNGLSIFNVIRLEVIDRTADLDRDNNGSPDGISLIGDFLYDATPMTTNAGTSTISSLFHAFYSPTDAFVGIEGAIGEGNSFNNMRLVGFYAPETTLSGSNAVSMNVITGFGDSFAQVPEPSALALLSIGLVGFGVARRRGSRA